MNRRMLRISSVALLALLLPGAEAPADVLPKASASAAAASASPAAASASSAAASASPAAASAAQEAPAPEGKSFAEDPPGPEKSSAPRPEEWKSAPKITLSKRAPTCRAYRIREWLKLRCDGFPAAGVSLLAGQLEGVMVWVDQDNESGSEAVKKPRAADVIFPVRRGDGRIVQIAQFGEGYDGPLGWNAAFTVSEQWVPGEAAPIITLW